METYEFFIRIGGKKEKVVIKKLDFGESNDLYQASTDYENVGGALLPKPNQGRMRELMILKSTVDAWYVVPGNAKKTHENIRSFPRAVGEKIADAIDAFNKVDEKKEASSGSQPLEEQTTQNSREK